MGNQIYENVRQSLINYGVHEDMAEMFLNKGIKDLELNPDTIDEKAMGIVLQKHILDAIQMFFDEDKSHTIIHKITLEM